MTMSLFPATPLPGGNLVTPGEEKIDWEIVQLFLTQ